MTLPRLGHAIIVNNIASEMPGSIRDVQALKEAYGTVGFDVQVHNDCDAQVRICTNLSEIKIVYILTGLLRTNVTLFQMTFMLHSYQ